MVLRPAERVLAAESFEHQRGSLETSGFLFDMAKTFEDLVCVAIREVLPARAGTARLQHRTRLDEVSTVIIKPGPVIVRDGRPVAVLGAKYKAERRAGFPDADLYQMLAYYSVLGLDTDCVLSARGGGDSALVAVFGPVRPVNRCSALDLAQAPSAVLTPIGQLTDHVTHLA